MAQNNTNEYRKFRYYEGVCASGDFVKEIAKVLSLGVKETYIDSNGQQQAIPMRVKNWDIVYPTVDSSFEGYEHINTRDKYFGNTNDPDDGIDKYYTRFTEKLENQIAQIKNNVVLKTTTTAKNANTNVDDLSVSGESDLAQTTMYVQIYKPQYLANPEEYPLDAELKGLTPQVITKEMYQEARKSTASVIYDLALLADNDNVSDSENIGFITKETKEETIDAVSDQIALNKLFGTNAGASNESNDGYLSGLKHIFGANYITDVITVPTATERETSCVLQHSQLNQIKQTEKTLYKFLYDICGSKTSFTETDYDLIKDMNVKVTLVGEDNAHAYVVTLTFNKMVEIYTINPNGTHPTLLVSDEYGHEALEVLKPELYSEGRYVPLPDKYLNTENGLDKEKVSFEPDVQFCLDRVNDESILYGTIVLRYNYNKKVDYTDLSSLNITDSVALENNHYCLIRIFDNPNADFSGPEPNILDNKGNITTTNSHVSPWSKLSWYQDFEEIMMDHIDEDVSVTSVTDGTLLVPLETAGLTSDTRISYWINTNNDRASFIVMGNPALDYERNRHLISACYIGRIDSFENSINDVSGNFALYTSSSTTPCKTTLGSYITQYHIKTFNNSDFVSSESDADASANIQSYMDYSNKIGGVQECSRLKDLGLNVYYITLTGNRFFNENEFPRYMIVKNDGTPVVLRIDPETSQPLYYDTVAYRNFIYGVSDTRSNQVAVYLNPGSLKDIDSDDLKDYKVYFTFGYYEEKFVITSGITRDAFGNVINIETIDDFGKNTSDGTTSVSMYHTRSKAFYQKHHFLFATTEEYMSKVMYGKSSYTGEYYADRIKITHGNDGPRGILSDTLVIDSSSLYPKDELVINKDFSKSTEELEETFTYFPITAPFSPLSDGPNARYGIALKKAEREPEYKDANKIIEIGINELIVLMGNNQIIDDAVNLPDTLSNGCKVYWSVKEDSNWIKDENGMNTEIVFADGTSVYRTIREYEANNVDIAWTEFSKGTGTDLPNQVLFSLEKSNGNKTTDFVSKVNVVPPTGGFELGSNITNIYYGYSDIPMTNSIIGGGTKAFETIDDGTTHDNVHRYAYFQKGTEQRPFNYVTIDVSHPISMDDVVNDGSIDTQWVQTLYNAHPDKYFCMFFTQDGATKVATQYNDGNTTTDIKDQIVHSFVSIAMHNDEYDKDNDEQYAVGEAYYDLLQYPCSVTAYTSASDSSSGIYINGTVQQRQEFIYQPYNQSLTFNVKGLHGDVKITRNHYSVAGTGTINSNNTVTISAAEMLDDLLVSIDAE